VNKIKAYTLLLSWSVIFAHSIIPHNHHDLDYTGCYNLVHTIDYSDYSKDNITRFDIKPLEETICHYSGFVFFQLNTDNLIISSNKTASSDSFEIVSYFNIQNSFGYISDPHLGKSALRAPPAL
jgi:hypothetical protein